MAMVQQWTGREVRALRDAMRMTLRGFAAHLGVSERMLSKWEAGRESITPRPVNQAALDTCLRRCDPDAKARFTFLVKDFGRLVPEVEYRTELIGANRVKHPIDGRPMVLVEGSVFLSGAGNEGIWLPSFYIDVFPVTNAQYAQFLAASGHPPPSDWKGTAAPADRWNHPVVFVNWHDASEYAQWAGKQLPSSLQWEKAARGTRGVSYPWGDQPTPAKCNVRENGVGSTTPVDRYRTGVSPYGVYDLCGNVWEWCRTETWDNRFELKGGAWTTPFERCNPRLFNDAASTMYDDDTGFRCVAASDAFTGQGSS